MTNEGNHPCIEIRPNERGKFHLLVKKFQTVGKCAIVVVDLNECKLHFGVPLCEANNMFYECDVMHPVLHTRKERGHTVTR